MIFKLRSRALTTVWIVALLSVAGCAQRSIPQTDNVSASMGNEQWELGSMGNQIVIASVHPVRDARIMQVTCNKAEKRLGVRVYPQPALSGPVGQQRLSLAFDGADPTPQNWVATPLVFDLWNADPGFAEVVGRLRSHRFVIATMLGGNGETQRVAFSLNGAQQAIDGVMAACSQKS